jgi:hypothetical protein
VINRPEDKFIEFKTFNDSLWRGVNHRFFDLLTPLHREREQLKEDI